MTTRASARFVMLGSLLATFLASATLRTLRADPPVEDLLKAVEEFGSLPNGELLACPDELRARQELARSKFCEDPFTFVCGASGIEFDDDYEHYQRTVGNPIWVRARLAVGAKYGQKWNDVPELTRFWNDRPPEVRKQIDDQLDQERALGYRDALQERRGVYDAIDLKALKRSVLATLEVTVKNSTLSPAQQGELLARIRQRLDQVEFVNPAAFYDGSLQAKGSEGRAVLQCGAYGQRANAFHVNGTNLVMVCPGLVIQASVRQERGAKNSGAAREWIETTLFHELGHLADQELKLSYDPYEKFTQCSLIQYGGELKRTADATLSVGEREKAFRSNYLDEAIADYWEAEALGAKLRSAGGRSRAEFLLTSALRPNCVFHEAPVDDAHAPARVRINSIFGRNPEIRAALGCPVLPLDEPYCGI